MIATKQEARNTARWGYYAAFVAAVSTTLLVILKKYAWLDYSALVDAFLFLVIGIGIWRMSKVAAIFGLILYVTETAWKWDTIGRSAFSALQIGWTAIFLFCFVQGVRGTLAYHTILKSEGASSPPSLTQV